MNVNKSSVRKEKLTVIFKRTTIPSKIMGTFANRLGSSSRISTPTPAKHNEQRIMPLAIYGALERQKRAEEEMKKRAAMGKLF